MVKSRPFDSADVLLLGEWWKLFKLPPAEIHGEHLPQVLAYAKASRDARMKEIETRLHDANFLAGVLSLARTEYSGNAAYLAVRIAMFDEYFALPWYKRIFSTPRSPGSSC